jgi:xanthine/uracil/vitamin C permease (AzgA family)
MLRRDVLLGATTFVTTAHILFVDAHLPPRRIVVASLSSAAATARSMSRVMRGSVHTETAMPPTTALGSPARHAECFGSLATRARPGMDAAHTGLATALRHPSILRAVARLSMRE